MYFMCGKCPLFKLKQSYLQRQVTVFCVKYLCFKVNFKSDTKYFFKRLMNSHLVIIFAQNNGSVTYIVLWTLTEIGIDRQIDQSNKNKVSDKTEYIQIDRQQVRGDDLIPAMMLKLIFSNNHQVSRELLATSKQ